MTNQQPIKLVLRCKSTRSKEYIEGSPVTTWLYGSDTQRMVPDSKICGGDIDSIYDNEVDHGAMEISLDGVEFHSLEFVKEAIDRQKSYLEKCIIDPTTWRQGYNPTYQCPHCKCHSLYDHVQKAIECPYCKEPVDWSKINEQ